MHPSDHQHLQHQTRQGQAQQGQGTHSSWHPSSSQLQGAGRGTAACSPAPAPLLQEHCSGWGTHRLHPALQDTPRHHPQIFVSLNKNTSCADPQVRVKDNERFNQDSIWWPRSKDVLSHHRRAVTPTTEHSVPQEPLLWASCSPTENYAQVIICPEKTEMF